MSRTPCSTAIAVAVLCASCAAPAPETGAETGDDVGNELLPAPTDARYVTHLMFAAPDGRAFFGSFDQTARQERLAREYDVWLADGPSWRALARARDTLPVARAAWRLLPVDGMSVRIGDAGQVVSLRFPPTADTGQDAVRLLAGEEVSVWTGPTGQRESLGLAVLETGPDAIPGILFFRRAARALRIPATGGDGRTFVFADSLGNGLLIHSGTLGQSAVAHTWLHGIETAWGDVTLEADSTDSTWRFEIPGTDLGGDIRPVSGEASGDASAIRLVALLSAGGQRFRFAGISAILPTP